MAPENPDFLVGRQQARAAWLLASASLPRIALFQLGGRKRVGGFSRGQPMPAGRTVEEMACRGLAGSSGKGRRYISSQQGGGVTPCRLDSGGREAPGAQVGGKSCQAA